MQLNSTQAATLRSHILANVDPVVVAARGVRDDTAIAARYNVASAVVVWRTRVPVDEYRAAVSWPEVDALTVGKARIWEWVTAQMTLPVNAGNAAVRQGIADAFGAATATRAALLAVAKRSATLAESLFATGTGTEASPATLGAEGALPAADVSAALGG